MFTGILRATYLSGYELIVFVPALWVTFSGMWSIATGDNFWMDVPSVVLGSVFLLLVLVRSIVVQAFVLKGGSEFDDVVPIRSRSARWRSSA